MTRKPQKAARRTNSNPGDPIPDETVTGRQKPNRARRKDQP